MTTLSTLKKSVRNRRRAGGGSIRATGLQSSMPSEDVPTFDILSLDVFDTITCRTWFSPRDIFTVLARELEPDGTEQRWNVIAVARHDAEKMLRADKGGNEPDLYDIHIRLAQLTSRDADTACTAADLELAIEQRSAREVRTMVERREIARGDGKQIVYLSDTYLSESQIRMMLGGTISESDLVFTSRDQAASKRKGDLFHRVATSRAPARYFHIGDKHLSDYLAPRDAGWGSEHFRTSTPSRYERLLASRRWSVALAGSAVAGSAKSARLATAGSNMRSAQLAAIGANVAGPLYTAFTAWCFKSAADLSCKNLIFLARDGQICAKIAQLQNTTLAFEYLYASRQALYLPATFSVGDEAWCWLEHGLANNTVSEALGRFGIDAHAVTDLLLNAGLSPNDRLDTHLRTKVISLLRGPLAESILRRAAGRRKLVCDYFRPALEGQNRVAFVDVGWKGRLQRCLERILDTDTNLKKVEICGLYLSLSDESALLRRPSTRTFVSYNQIDSPIIVEILAPADHGTTLGYEQTATGDVQPVLAPMQSDLVEEVGNLQGAAVTFAADLYDNIENASLDCSKILDELRGAALEVLRLLTNEPTSQEAACLGGFLHSDDPNHVRSTMLAPILSRSEMASALLLGVNQGSRRLSYWFAGSLVRSLPRARFMVRPLLAMSALRLALHGRSKKLVKRGRYAVRARLP